MRESFDHVIEEEVCCTAQPKKKSVQRTYREWLFPTSVIVAATASEDSYLAELKGEKMGLQHMHLHGHETTVNHSSLGVGVSLALADSAEALPGPDVLRNLQARRRG